MRQRAIRLSPQLGKRLLDWLSMVLLGLMVVVPMVFLGWLVLFTNTFTVQAVTVVDAREHTMRSVEELVGEVQERNILFIQTDILEQAVLSEVPQIRTIHIARKLPATLKVVVQEKEPVLMILSKGKYYFVDGGGIAYEEAGLDALPGVILPTVKNNDQEAELTIGTRVVEEAFVSFIEDVQQAMPDVVQAQVVEIRIPSLAAREVHVLLDNNWEIKFDITRPSASQLAVLRQLLTGTVTEEERQTLEYVDLRIPNRVYYKTR